MKTVNDLKAYLREIIDNLEEKYDGSEEIETVYNTYWVTSPYIATRNGFISLESPVNEPEEEE